MSAEHQTSGKSRPMKQKLLDNLREKADAAAPHKLWFCQILVGHSCQEREVCLDAVPDVLEGALGARDRLGGNTETLVLCKVAQRKRLAGVLVHSCQGVAVNKG